MISDEQLDVRLQEAGTRWRAGHNAAAAIDLTALEASDSAVTGLVHEVLPEPTTSGAKARHRRNRWLAAAGGIAAAALTTVLVVQFGGHSTSGPPVPVPPVAPLSGTTWLLSGLHNANGVRLPVAQHVTLQFGAGGRVLGGDGCGTFNGPVSVTEHELTVRGLAHSANGCVGLSSGATRQIRLIQAVIERGTLRWSVSGSTLTLSRPGVGSLDYAAVAPGAIPPAAIGTDTWTLQQVEVVALHGDTQSDSGHSSASQTQLSFDDVGSFTIGACPTETGHARFLGASVTFSDRHSDSENGGDVNSCDAGMSSAASRELRQVQAVLSGAARWRVRDGNLILSRAGITLTFSQ